MKILRIIFAAFVALSMAACHSSAGTEAHSAPSGAAGVAKVAAVQQKTISDDAQRRLDYYYLEANNAQNMEAYDVSFELFKHCYDINPQAADVIYMLGLHYNMLGEKEMSRQYFERAAQLDDKNEVYKQTLLSVYKSQGVNDSLVSSVYEQLLELKPNDIDYMGNLMMTYIDQERYDEALKLLDRMEKVDGYQYNIALSRCNIYFNTNNQKATEAEIKRLVREYPNELSYRAMLAEFYLDQKEFKKVRNLIDEIRAVDDGTGTLQLLLMNYYTATGEDSLYLQAQDSLIYGAKVNDDIRARVMNSYIYESEKNDSNSARVMQMFRRQMQVLPEDKANDIHSSMIRYMAIKEMSLDSLMVESENLLAKVPNKFDILEPLLRTYIQKGMFEKGYALGQQAVAAYPKEFSFYYFTGLIAYQLDSLDQSEKYFKEGINQVSDDTQKEQLSMMYSLLGDVCYAKVMHKEAYAAYDSSLVYDADNVQTLNNYAYYLSLDKTELDKAEQMSYRTIRLEPNNKNYLDTYAWVLFVKGEYTEAKIYMERVIEDFEVDVDSAFAHIEGVNAGVLEHAGDIYSMCGEQGKALKYWLLAKRKGGDSLLLQKKIKLKKYIER